MVLPIHNANTYQVDPSSESSQDKERGKRGLKNGSKGKKNRAKEGTTKAFGKQKALAQSESDSDSSVCDSIGGQIVDSERLLRLLPQNEPSGHKAKSAFRKKKSAKILTDDQTPPKKI